MAKTKQVSNVLIGADIELFLFDKKKKEVISAEGFIKGTKHEPYNFDPTNKYFATSLDNVEAEFCIPPVTDKVKFREYIKKAVDYINSTLPKTICTVAYPAFILDDKYLQTEQARVFGCEPDFCVWTQSMNERPEDVNPNLRSAGGHIHIGYDNPDIETSEILIKAMDLYVGVPSVIQEPDNQRKELYGKAGCFRFKEYGVEYRTISNYYLEKDNLIDWAFDSTMRAINFVNNNGKISKKLGEEIQHSINNNDKKLAERIIKEHKLELA